jgi:hypothetical protein
MDLQNSNTEEKFSIEENNNQEKIEIVENIPQEIAEKNEVQEEIESQENRNKNKFIKKTLPPNTIYNALQRKKMEFSRKDLRKVANAVLMKYYKHSEGKEPEKIEQIEDGKTYSVYCYPESMRKEINNIISWFFNEKKMRVSKHEKQLKLERLDKLKRTDSPDYFLELARYNIAAEDERKRKKEKEKEMKEKANQNLNSKAKFHKKNFNKNKPIKGKFDSKNPNNSNNFKKLDNINNSDNINNLGNSNDEKSE